MERWIIPKPVNDRKLLSQLASELSLPPSLAELLIRRGIVSCEHARSFVRPLLKTLSDPFLLPNMDAAIDRILRALDRKERIVLYGDYDVDGVTSLALFMKILRSFEADVHCFLPIRADEGYGLTPDGVSRCLAELQPQLLLALDCGTSSIDEIALLKAKGIDVVVFDHHECKESLPPCVALVNPKLGDSFHYLCSAGIVFKACHALLKRRPSPTFDLKEYLDLVALGTVADIVPLQDENRVLVQRGLMQLAQTRSVGLRLLMEAAGIEPPLSPADIGFRIGPRLNAAGRLGTAQEALELLMTEDLLRARGIARSLDSQNRERQLLEQRVLEEAEAQLASLGPIGSAIVLYGDGWHPGVLGIVASRIGRSHYRPTIIMGFDENGMGKGSGRSIEGLSLVEALGQCSKHLQRFGGHEMAAGLTIEKAEAAAFRQAFLQSADSILSEQQLQPRIHLDAQLDLGDLDFDFLDAHESLQPFGSGNPQPLFYVSGVTPACEPRILKEKHVRFEFQQRRARHSAMFFNGAKGQLPRPPWDVAFQIERNVFNERVTVQMLVRAIRSTPG